MDLAYDNIKYIC